MSSAATVSLSGINRTLCTSAAMLLTLLLLAAWAMAPTLRLDIPPEQIRPFAGLPHTVRLPAARFPYVIPGDSVTEPERSALVLYENGMRFGFRHAQHDWIRDNKCCSYSHWGRLLIFSSSDGTDPRTNGRRYSIEAPAELNRWVLWPWIVTIFVLGSLGSRPE